MEVAIAQATDAAVKPIEPDQEHLAPAQDVAERARGQQQRGERQRVDVDDPLQLRDAAAEVGLICGSAMFTIVLSR